MHLYVMRQPHLKEKSVWVEIKTTFYKITLINIKINILVMSR